MSKVRYFIHKHPFLFTKVRDGVLVLCVRQATIVGYIECLSGGYLMPLILKASCVGRG